MKLSRLDLRLILFSAAVVLSLAVSAGSSVPTTISYQGRLTNADGSPVADGEYEVTFSIYDATTAGAVFWSETHPAVVVTDGLFLALLGSVIPFGIDGTSNPTKAGEDAWLTISVDGGPESDPRIPLVSVPSAFSALRADSADYARQADWSDTAGFAVRSAWSDSADFSFGTMWSDTSGYASGSGWSDTSDYAFSAGWIDTAEIARSVVNGSISNASIAEGAVNSSSIADGSIALSDIGTNGATNGKIMKWNIASGAWVIADDNAGSGGVISVLPGSGLSGGGSTPIVTLDVAEEGIGSYHIDTGAIRNSELAINAVAAENIQPQVIDNSKIAINTITGDRIANKTVGAGDMADSTIGWQQLKPNAIVSSRIAPNTIDTSDIGTGGVGSDEIVDGSVEGADIADGSLTGAEIAIGSLTGAHILDNSIGSIDLGTNSVDADELATNSVGEVELQNGAVTGPKLAASSVDSDKIMNNNITAIDLSHNSVGNDELAPDAVSEIELRNGAVTEAKLVNNSIRSGKIQDSSLFAHDLADEPGVASSQYKGTLTMSLDFATIDSAEINCPSAGYIFASANVSVTIDNGTLQNSYFAAILRLDGLTTGYGSKLEWRKDGVLCTTVPIQFVFSVSAGLHNVKVEGWKLFDGEVQTGKTDLVLMFIPTAYGDIAAPTKAAESGRPAESQR